MCYIMIYIVSLYKMSFIRILNFGHVTLPFVLKAGEHTKEVIEDLNLSVEG